MVSKCHGNVILKPFRQTRSCVECRMLCKFHAHVFTSIINIQEYDIVTVLTIEWPISFHAPLFEWPALTRSGLLWCYIIIMFMFSILLPLIRVFVIVFVILHYRYTFVCYCFVLPSWFSTERRQLKNPRYVFLSVVDIVSYRIFGPAGMLCRYVCVGPVGVCCW